MKKISTTKRNIIEILGEKKLENAEGFVPYKSIVFCVIDSIFSIRAKYNPTTINVLERVALTLELKSRYDEYKVTDFINRYEKITVEKLAVELFGNKQRTSSKKGVLKAQAVMEAMKILKVTGIDTIDDFNKFSNKELIKSKWLKIKGQSSGTTWRYLCMLTGNQTEFKDDTHIYNFFIRKLSYTLIANNDYENLKKAF